jgi:hypothetical protein
LRDRGEREAGNRGVGERRKGEIEGQRRKRYGTEEWWRGERGRLRDRGAKR